MIAPDTDGDVLFKRLHLANARRTWRDLVQRGERETWSYRDFLALCAILGIRHASPLLRSSAPTCMNHKERNGFGALERSMITRTVLSRTQWDR
jgi:hypothetical protein